MRSNIFAVALALLLWGTPALAQDSDDDGVGDEIDNCLDLFNPAQDDTDQDDCGNLCDADYDNSGIVGFADFLEFAENFGCPNRIAPPCPCVGAACEVYMHSEPIPFRSVAFIDFLYFASKFGSAPGPSGSTAGTTACPKRVLPGD